MTKAPQAARQFDSRTENEVRTPQVNRTAGLRRMPIGCDLSESCNPAVCSRLPICFPVTIGIALNCNRCPARPSIRLGRDRSLLRAGLGDDAVADDRERGQASGPSKRGLCERCSLTRRGSATRQASEGETSTAGGVNRVRLRVVECARLRPCSGRRIGVAKARRSFLLTSARPRCTMQTTGRMCSV